MSKKQNLVNIGESQDEHYRYKMPAPRCTMKVHRTSFKTSIHNMIDIALALRVPCTYLTRYLGIELSTSSTYEAGITVLNGEYQADVILRVLQKFIKAFVLCPNCRLPEIKLVVNKQECIVYDCACCGSSGKIPEIHKLVNFIKSNPPDLVDDIEIFPTLVRSASEEHMRSASEEHMRRMQSEEHMRSASEEQVSIENEDVIEWEMEFDKSSKKKRRKELLGKSQKEKSIEEILVPIDGAMSASVMKIIESPENLKQIIIVEALSPEQLAIVVYKVFVNTQGYREILKSLKEKQEIIKLYIDTTRTQLQLLKCFELLGHLQGDMCQYVVPIFKALYWYDLVDEDTFLLWDTLYIVEEFHNSAKPFVVWLKNSEVQ